jgi:hypothetical protein
VAEIELISPVPAGVSMSNRVASPLESLVGRKIGFRAEWDAFHVFCDRLSERLAAAGEVTSTTRWETSFARSGDEATRQRSADLERFAAGIDAAVVGLAA